MIRPLFKTEEQLQTMLLSARRQVTVPVDGQEYTYEYDAAGYETGNNDPTGVARTAARRVWEHLRLAESAPIP